MDRATATAAPTAVKIGNATYKLTPLKDSDYGEFEKWLQDRQYEIVKRNLDGLSPEIAVKLLAHAHDRATCIGFADDESIRVMSTYEGAVKLAWMSLRIEHPELKEDDVAELLFDPGVLSDVMDKLPMGMPDGAGERKKKRTGTKAAARKKKTKARKRRST